MIDTHAHLDFEDFDENREEVIQRFFENGGKAIINIGVDLATSKKSIELAEKHENIYASVGLHPDFFSEQGSVISEQQKLFNELKELAKRKKVVAIGEMGLDYFRIGESREIGEIRERQKKGFLAQIELAGELGLPVIVHCREAWDDLFETIKNFQFSIFPPKADPHRADNFQTNLNEQISKNKNIPNTRYEIPDTKFVLHCYSGDGKDTEKFLKLPNVYFSFSGNITYPKPGERAAKLAEAVRVIPFDRIMLDSDSPFLAPQTMRGKRNEPAYVRYIAEKIAQIKGISAGEVEKATDDNAEAFFEFSP